MDVETRTVDKMNETYDALTVKPEDSIVGVNINATVLYNDYGYEYDDRKINDNMRLTITNSK